MYLVIGANGFLGTYIIRNIIKHTNEKIIATARHIDKVIRDERIIWNRCDISKQEDVDELHDRVVENDEPFKIVFLAAYHNPDLVDKYPQIAWNTNITALSYFINKFREAVHLVYPSTDTVYGESKDGYCFKENDELHPLNQYGRHKVLAEMLVREFGYTVVRFPFLIAPSLVHGRKHFYDDIVENLREGKCVKMFDDSYRSSLNFNDAAGLLVEVMEKHQADWPLTINVCGDCALTKYDIGLKIADKFGITKSLVVPISIKNYTGIFLAKRASSTLMDNGLIKSLLGLERISFSL